ncbi:MAG: hypothetical protein ABFD91_14360 [Anaerohalosphaeraceae bacterium]
MSTNQLTRSSLCRIGLLCLLCSWNMTQGAILADSVNDWQTAFTNDGTLNQGELGWEYGYISNFTGMNGVYYGWHQSFFYWQKDSGIVIFWPAGQIPPDVAWGEGGDSTGCRPPMHWVDGAYPWAGGDINNRWAAARRWVSNYTGAMDITGIVSRYFDPLQLLGWDILFVVAINAKTIDAPAIYTRYLAWNDANTYNFIIPAVPLKQGDTVDFLYIPITGNANRSYIRMNAVIRESTDYQGCDLDGNGIVNLNDFISFSSYWQNGDCGNSNWCGRTDLNFDWKTDMIDLSIFASEWLRRTSPRGDFDTNYRVDMEDLAAFSQQWQATDCEMNNWCQGCDINRDRTLDLADSYAWISNWLVSE